VTSTRRDLEMEQPACSDTSARPAAGLTPPLALLEGAHGARNNEHHACARQRVVSWLERVRRFRPWRQVSVRGAVADTSAVPPIREVQRANMPYGNSGVTPAHHGRHRMHAPFVSQGSASLQQRGRACVKRPPCPDGTQLKTHTVS
jgi:hypothetical protein